MFSSRRFLAAFLIVTVLSAGFGLLLIPLVQNATAQVWDCDYYIETCEEYWEMATIVCLFYGDDTYICELAKDYAEWWCAYYPCFYCPCA